MKRFLLTPDMENMTDTAIIFSFGVLCVGAPARKAMSASPVASMTRLARMASRPALLSVMTPFDQAILHDGRDAEAMQQRRDAGLLDQDIGHPLEHLGIERVAQGLRLRHGGAHGLGPVLELDADAFAIDGLLVPIPGEALDARPG
jgi:hypothetical protein